MSTTDAASGTPAAFASGLLNPASYFAVGAATVSIFTGIVAYIGTPVVVGFSRDDIERAKIMITEDEEVDEAEFLLHLLMSHREWIRLNERANRRETFFLNTSLVLLLLEIEYFGISVASIVAELSLTTVRQLLLVVTLLSLVPILGAALLKQ